MIFLVAVHAWVFDATYAPDFGLVMVVACRIGLGHYVFDERLMIGSV
jgi:hypothetical protein